jgi:S-adenosylmethionine-diacylglycerol 3-amino-3-carboxypropyl transferase
MFNSLLYKGGFIKKNSKLSYFDYYYQAFERLFKLDIKRSHFLQLCFFGKVMCREALPIEFSPEIFNKIKYSSLMPVYQVGSIFERTEKTLYDLISLSDVPSYLSGDLEKNYIQILKKNTAQAGVIINRFYLRSTEETDLSGFTDTSIQFQDLVEQELVQMYQLQVLQKNLSCS